MKKNIIICLLLMTTFLTSCGISQDTERYGISDVDISVFEEEYGVTDTLQTSLLQMGQLQLDYEYRGIELNYTIVNHLDEALISLAKNSDGEYVIFVVPQNNQYDVLVLNEFIFPSRETIANELDIYASANGKILFMDHITSGEYYPLIEVRDFSNELEEELLLGTLFMVYVAADNSLGLDIYIIIDSNGNYAFIEVDYHFENANLIHQFSR